VTITGDGTQTRDFVFVGDIARTTAVAATASLTGHHVVNVATGRETSLLDLHAAIEQVMGCPLPYTFGPQRVGDVYRSCADVTRMRDLLAVACTTPLADGLRMLLLHA
jgi:UDP-glucose 4-epimerase